VRGTAFVTGYGIGASVAGTVNSQLLHAADWLPTLVGLGGGTVAGKTLPLDGMDQWEVISRPNVETQRTEVVYGHEAASVNAGIRIGDWKVSIVLSHQVTAV